jgi:hypothetical protein
VTAVVVPGNETRVDGVWRISGACVALVREAERLAGDGVSVVVFTGWSRGGEPSEAEQIRDAWRGPDVELVVEPRDLPARITPEQEPVQVPHSQTLVVPRRFPAVVHVHDQVFVLEDTAVAGVDALRVDVVLLA